MRLALLALLAKEPAHGYQLKQSLERTFGAAYPHPNIGQIYVTLGRLEQSGLIQGQDVNQSSRPNKRVYEITEDGREYLAGWFAKPTDGPRVRDEFFMKLVLAPATGIADRQALINQQRRHCLSTMRGLSRLAAAEDRDNRAAHLLIEGAALHLQADLDWLERCQDELADSWSAEEDKPIG
ncbi:PadR family transcriptional regulator [Streptomyces luteolifulvus]|uniref:PadR family transcriptional regulator n=1 Tax=Streptomyces luteolifulvus TaxID=2615112 RepID=A0A6H9UXX7_9ACTN|nr:PadR family transcriptional regulator [Streptomyces luteolifulvus]KAB1144718.1 PadR family transcriptional regulator [Streptomyces luteolifulvus]